jgi:hypothetical protein
MKVKASYFIGSDETSRIVTHEVFESNSVARVGLPVDQKLVKVR